MAIELHVEIKVVDTEPENPFSKGIVLRCKKVTALQSEVADMGGIMAITSAVVDDVTDEVRRDIQDQIDVVTRQPG